MAGQKYKQTDTARYTQNNIETKVPKTFALAKAFGYLFMGEIGLFMETLDILPPNPVIINIGAGAGTSGLLFLEYREDTRLFTLDIAAGNVPTGSLLGERHALEHAGYWGLERHTQIKGDSIQVGKKWAGPQADFVFVDGDHSYAHAKGDIETWWELLNPGGWMTVHDYEMGNWGDVVQAVDDFIEEHKKEISSASITVSDTLIAFRKKK